MLIQESDPSCSRVNGGQGSRFFCATLSGHSLSACLKVVARCIE